MYEKHFSLKSRPFRSSIETKCIFVGPAQVRIMNNLKKALAASDSIVMVTGQVGVGKTTIVNRALEAVGSKRIVARVGRMKLAADEVLELLLTELNVSRQPTGTIQRFSAFKRLLHEWSVAGTRAFIVVEDAERIGIDALIELEALTAADHGDGTGANIVLMGQPSLTDLASAPALARLRQRIRSRQEVGPFSVAETQGYLKHCIRNAGGEFDRIFDPDAADMVYRCTNGVPRVINNLCESVLAAAAEAAAPLVMPQLVQHVAHEEFGLHPSAAAVTRVKPDMQLAADKTAKKPMPVAKQAETVRPPADERIITAPPLPNEDIETVRKSSGLFEPVPVSQFTSAAGGHVAAEPAAIEAPAVTRAVGPGPSMPVDDAEQNDAIPELIQDTQPELAALTVEDDLPDLTDILVPAKRSTDKKPSTSRHSTPATTTSGNDQHSDVVVPTLDDIPTLSGDLKISKSGKTSARKPAAMKAALPEPVPVAESGDSAEQDVEDPKLDATITEIPDWDRDPTLAQLKPDIQALEEALALVPEPIAKAVPQESIVPAAPAAPDPGARTSPKLFDLPEITLEKELQVKEIEALNLLRKSTSPEVQPQEDEPVKRKHGFDLDRIAEELGKARSIEDVDDKLAETLFGEEMAAAAAEVAAMVAADEAANQAHREAPDPEPKQSLKMEQAESPALTKAAAPGPAKPNPSGPAAPTPSAPNPVAAKTSAPNSAAPKPAAPKPAAAKPVTPKPAATATAVEIPPQSASDPDLRSPEPAPVPIEDQFGTSMTATLKALTAAQDQKMSASANDDEDPDDEQKSARRLFGLFRGNS